VRAVPKWRQCDLCVCVCVFWYTKEPEGMPRRLQAKQEGNRALKGRRRNAHANTHTHTNKHTHTQRHTCRRWRSWRQIVIFFSYKKGFPTLMWNCINNNVRFLLRIWCTAFSILPGATAAIYNLSVSLFWEASCLKYVLMSNISVSINILALGATVSEQTLFKLKQKN